MIERLTMQQIRNMSANQLKNKIRQKTENINTILKTNTDIENTFAVEQTIKKLQSIGAKGRQGNTIGLGFRKGRTKESLIRQLRELDYAEPLLADYKGTEMLDEKYRKARDSFMASNEFDGMTESEWRDIVETFGAVGKEVVEQFDSTAIANQFSENTRSIDMVQLMKDTLKETKGMGLDKDGLTDYFIQKLTELIG